MMLNEQGQNTGKAVQRVLVNLTIGEKTDYWEISQDLECCEARSASIEKHNLAPPW